MAEDSHIEWTDAEREGAAKELCFQDCAAGAHLDPENGCVSVCKHRDECVGWRPYLSDARRLLDEVEHNGMPGVRDG